MHKTMKEGIKCKCAILTSNKLKKVLVVEIKVLA